MSEVLHEASIKLMLKACPCLHTTPCSDRCTCVMQFSSSGCLRCCSYGSPEQQKAKAERLASVIDQGWKDYHGT